MFLKLDHSDQSKMGAHWKLAVCCVTIAVTVTSVSAAQTTPRTIEQIFLQHQSTDSFQVNSALTNYGPNVAGSLVVNTNAVPSASEESRYSALASSDNSRIVSSVEGLTVLVDDQSQTLFIAGTNKGSGGNHVAFGHYKGAIPSRFAHYDLKGLSMAGVTLGSSAHDVLSTFGVPGDRLGSSVTGIAGFRADYSEADGIYKYVGAVPMKAQSCRRMFAITIRHRVIVAMSETVQC